MNSPVTHAECEKHREKMEGMVKDLVRESEARTRREIAGLREDIQGMRAKIDQLPWQLVGMCVVIIGAIVYLAVA